MNGLKLEVMRSKMKNDELEKLLSDRKRKEKEEGKVEDMLKEARN